MKGGMAAMLAAFARVVRERPAGACRLVLACTVVDRGERAAPFFAGAGVPYRPLLTYGDLDIPPVG
jgi:orotate phosphoribosyltransferase